MQDITNTDKVIDSRDVIARIETLQADDDRDEAEAEELALLLTLSAECDGHPEWKDGVTLIHDSYFETYAQELAEDLGAIDRSAGWPSCHIDWKAAAESLQIDYTRVDFAGETYWHRS